MGKIMTEEMYIAVFLLLNAIVLGFLLSKMEDK
jgi:hypothetical protein